MIEIKPLGRKLTAKQIGEFESRDWLGEETWIRYKQELDTLLSYRKSFKGKPTDEQLSQLEFNKELIEWYNGELFHSFMLAFKDRCACVRCEKRRNPPPQKYSISKVEQYPPEIEDFFKEVGG